MPARLAQKELQGIGRRLDGSGERNHGLGVRRLLDDLDRTLVELAHERVLLQLRELVRLGDLGEVGCAHAPGLLGLLEQLTDFLDDEDVVDVDLSHAGGAVDAVGEISRVRVAVSRGRPIFPSTESVRGVRQAHAVAIRKTTAMIATTTMATNTSRRPLASTDPPRVDGLAPRVAREPRQGQVVCEVGGDGGAGGDSSTSVVVVVPSGLLVTTVFLRVKRY